MEKTILNFGIHRQFTCWVQNDSNTNKAELYMIFNYMEDIDYKGEDILSIPAEQWRERPEAIAALVYDWHKWYNKRERRMIVEGIKSELCI